MLVVTSGGGGMTLTSGGGGRFDEAVLRDRQRSVSAMSSVSPVRKPADHRITISARRRRAIFRQGAAARDCDGPRQTVCRSTASCDARVASSTDGVFRLAFST